MKQIIKTLFLAIIMICAVDVNAQILHYSDCYMLDNIVMVNDKPFSGKIYSPTNIAYLEVRNGNVMATVCLYPSGKIASKKVVTSPERSVTYYYDKSGNLLLEQNAYKGYSSQTRVYRVNGSEVTPNTNEYDNRKEVVFKYIRENIVPLNDKAYSEMRSGILRYNE